MAERVSVADDLERLIDTANAPIFGIDREGRVNEWNRKTAQIMGYSKEEAMGNNLVERYITPEFQQSVRSVLQRPVRRVACSIEWRRSHWLVVWWP